VQRRNRQRELLRTTRQSRPSHKPRQVDRQCQILPSSKNLLLLRFLLLLLPLLPPLASLHLLRLLPRQLFLRPRNPNQSNSPNNLNKLLLLFLLLLLLKSYDVPSFNIPLKLDLSDTSGKDTMPLYSLRELTSTIRPTGLRPLLRTTIQGSSPNLSHLLVVFRQVPTPPRLDTDPSRILIQSQSTVDNASVRNGSTSSFFLLFLHSSFGHSDCLPSLDHQSSTFAYARLVYRFGKACSLSRAFENTNTPVLLFIPLLQHRKYISFSPCMISRISFFSTLYSIVRLENELSLLQP